MAEAGGLVARVLQSRSVLRNRSCCRAELKKSLESGKQDWGAMEERRHLVMVVGDQVLPAAPGVRDRGLSRRS